MSLKSDPAVGSQAETDAAPDHHVVVTLHKGPTDRVAIRKICNSGSGVKGFTILLANGLKMNLFPFVLRNK